MCCLQHGCHRIHCFEQEKLREESDEVDNSNDGKEEEEREVGYRDEEASSKWSEHFCRQVYLSHACVDNGEITLSHYYHRYPFLRQRGREMLVMRTCIWL